MKRIMVNAQVTFMISVLELIGYIFIISMVIIFKSTSLPLIINIEIMYLIVLPRAYLMNTSHNKRRIIEHGWKNILKNTFGLSHDLPNSNCCKENRMIENQSPDRARKRRVTVNQYKKRRIHPQITSRDVNKPSPRISRSKLKIVITEDSSDCKMGENKKRCEIMMIPDELKQFRRIDRTSKNLLSIEKGAFMERKNILGCKEKNRRKRSCLENGALSVTDLEQECEILFSCK